MFDISAIVLFAYGLAAILLIEVAAYLVLF